MEGLPCDGTMEQRPPGSLPAMQEGSGSSGVLMRGTQADGPWPYRTTQSPDTL